MLIFYTSPSVNVILYVRPFGRNKRELWSIILGFDENLILDRSAFNLGVNSYLFLSEFFYSFDFGTYSDFLDLKFFFPLKFYRLPSWLLSFLIKYFDPLNYRVRVADTKKIFLLSLSKICIYFLVSGTSLSNFLFFT